MAKPVVRKPKKKANPLKSAKIENIDYKDVQEQRLIATAVKNAREMALLPYSSSAR